MRRGDPSVAVGYVRVSTDEQQLGPDAQRNAVAAWATAHGCTVVEWHEDRVSGVAPLDERPGLLAALDAVRRLRAGLLVAHRRDRVARDVVLTAQVEQLAQRAGADVVTADGAGVGDGPEAALFRRLLDAFAGYELAVIRLRTRNALAVRRRRGERFSGRAPLGLRFAGDGQRRSKTDPPTLLEANPVEEQALERMRRLYAQGLSFTAIARVMNAAGDRPRGRRWHRTTIVRVLAKEAS